MAQLSADEMNGYVLRAIEDLDDFVKNHMREENERFLRVEDSIKAIDNKLNVVVIIVVAAVVLLLGPKALALVGLVL